METNSNRLLVFCVVGTLLVTLVTFAAWLFSASNPDGAEYLIRFKNGVAGLEKGSPVTFSGVPAGAVTSVRLADNDPSTVLVKVRLDPQLPVVRGVKATISRSLMGDSATLTLDGAEKNAPPITRLNGQTLPEIPAKKGGLLGGGGDPMAFIEKISRSVDNVSANLNARGQERLRERLAMLDRQSAGWSSDASRVSDTLTGAQGRISRVGGSIARSGEAAARLNDKLTGRRGTALESVNEALESASRGASNFGAKARGARPAIASADRQRRAITDQVRAARTKVRGFADRAQEIDRDGLRLFGSPRLPDYKRRKASARRPNVPPPSR